MQRLVSIPWSTFFGSLFMMLTIAGLIGNMVVIIAISGDVKMRKSVMNMLLLNLAIADFLNLITTTVEWTHTIVLGYPAWVFPDILCPIARYFECVFLFTSILTQLTVCVERSDALAMRRSVVKMLVVCVSIYFICYSPIQAIFLSKVLFNVSLHPPYEFILLMNALAMTCSACNPLLYTLFSKRFRARITRLLGCGVKSASAESVFNGRTYEITYSFSRQLPEKPLRTSVMFEKELYPSQNTIIRSV
ncbi:7 transmembrane receptor (rhodopsin family) domain-containing protein [Ditylenchus destructor]|uniref:7 transmembrane receptor (Rhodopsin family) domain-containing protein n=1 Tax=Ditylenchus destructor TaxID=166010 RepID=A0AAD4NID7_9BILA|nr:7 transmembrane receptor (rhodopsin family) domain-containing protein [Ditylenchus destructor]